MKRVIFQQLGVWRLVVATLLFAGVASADSIITASELDRNLGGSIWASASSTPTDAYFAGEVYMDVLRNSSAYDRSTLWVGLLTDICIADIYGNQGVENLSNLLGTEPRPTTWVDHLFDPPADPGDTSDD